MLSYMLCYVVLYVMLCYVMLCYVMLCYVMLCYVMLCYEFLSRIASSVLRVNCYQLGSCVGGPSAFNSPFPILAISYNELSPVIPIICK